MKMIPTPTFPFVARLMMVALAIFAFAGPASSAVIYRNNFGNNSGANIAFNSASIGWSLLRSQNSGNVFDASSTAGSTQVGINNSTGRPTNLSNVNAPTSANDALGLAFVRNSATAGQHDYALAFTTQYTVDRSIYDVDSFQWYANTTFATTQALAVQVGGLWYVTAGVTPVTGAFGTFSTTNSALISFDFDTATWYGLTYTVGSTPFTVGSSTALPTGNITGFGIYMDLGTLAQDFSRFDTFTINAVPEPGVLSLVGLAGLALLGRRKKRRV